MGIRGSSTCDLIFEDCIVPKENLLGKEGKGFKIAMQTLDGGRIGIAAQALGLGEGAVNEAVKYTQERVQFGKRLSQFQNTQFQLADMHTRMQAAQYLVYAAAMKKQNHEDYSMDASMAKLFAAEAPPMSRAAPSSCSAATATPASIPWAHDARRQDHRDLRGYQRGPADGYFQPPGREVR